VREGSFWWVARWLWWAAAGVGRLTIGKALGVSSLMARKGERDDGCERMIAGVVVRGRLAGGEDGGAWLWVAIRLGWFAGCGC
jgi:hypothetical protein